MASTQFRGLANVNTPILNDTRNRFLMKYNASTDKFDLVSADSFIDTSTTDGSVPNAFITQIEQQINTSNITNIGSLDGGTF